MEVSMALTPQTRDRLKLKLTRELRIEPVWMFIRQMFTAEASEETPDFETLTEFMIDTFREILHAEKVSALERTNKTPRRQLTEQELKDREAQIQNEMRQNREANKRRG